MMTARPSVPFANCEASTNTSLLFFILNINSVAARTATPSRGPRPSGADMTGGPDAFWGRQR